MDKRIQSTVSEADAEVEVQSGVICLIGENLEGMLTESSDLVCCSNTGEIESVSVRCEQEAIDEPEKLTAMQIESKFAQRKYEFHLKAYNKAQIRSASQFLLRLADTEFDESSLDEALQAAKRIAAEQTETLKGDLKHREMEMSLANYNLERFYEQNFLRMSAAKTF